MKEPKEWLNTTTFLPRDLKWRITRSRISTLTSISTRTRSTLSSLASSMSAGFSVCTWCTLARIRLSWPGNSVRSRASSSGTGPPCENSQTVSASAAPPGTGS